MFLFPSSFFTAEAYMASLVMVCSAWLRTYTKVLPESSNKVCSMRNYCSFFGQVCKTCRHVNLDDDEDGDD